MPAGHSERYQALVQKQRSMTRETWRVLQEHGITSESPLRLDFTYRAPHQHAAESLRKRLAAETDYELDVWSSGWLFHRRWNLSGTTSAAPVSGEILDQWVQRMVENGHHCGCEFDGWGTSIPSPAAKEPALSPAGFDGATAGQSG